MKEINIRFLKLVSGESLYAEIIDDNINHITVKNPLVITVINDKPVVFEWIFETDCEVFTINKRHVLINARTNDKIKQSYLEFFVESETEESTPITQTPPDVTLH